MPSIRKQAQARAVNALRRIVLHILEESEVGAAFTIPQVAANSSTRIVDAHQLTGEVSRPHRRLVQNFEVLGYIEKVTERTYRVTEEGRYGLLDLSKDPTKKSGRAKEAARQAMDTLSMLSQQNISGSASNG